MPRAGVTTTFAAAIAAPVIRPFYLIQIEFTNETLYLWTGLGTLTWNGQIYQGAGTLLSIEGVSEDSEVVAKGVTLKLSGANSVIALEAINNIQRGLPVFIYLGLFEADGKTVVPNPVLDYVGRTDQPTIEDAGDSSTITLAIENALADMNRSVWRRYTDADQQLDHPGDLGMQFVPNIQELQVYFGQLPQSRNN